MPSASTARLGQGQVLRGVQLANLLHRRCGALQGLPVRVRGGHRCRRSQCGIDFARHRVPASCGIVKLAVEGGVGNHPIGVGAQPRVTRHLAGLLGQLMGSVLQSGQAAHAEPVHAGKPQHHDGGDAHQQVHAVGDFPGLHQDLAQAVAMPERPVPQQPAPDGAAAASGLIG